MNNKYCGGGADKCIMQGAMDLIKILVDLCAVVKVAAVNLADIEVDVCAYLQQILKGLPLNLDANVNLIANATVWQVAITQPQL